MKKGLWITWGVVCIAIGVFFGVKLLSDDQDKSVFLIGETTYGHYQIELSCDSCHTSPFGGQEILQNACVNCHADELEEAQDSHPKSKFTDPRDAYRLENIDATYCVSCHVEHQRDATHPMGVTLPDDYCYHCHIETIEERESHKDLPFDSCADAGCHNYHDNRALYESFLVKNSGHPWIASALALDEANYASFKAPHSLPDTNNIQVQADAPHDWVGSAHEQAGVSCSGCHNKKDENNQAVWLEKPGIGQCQQCHQTEAEGFMEGKHGMRLIAIDESIILSGNFEESKVAPIKPAESHLAFHNNMLDASHGCNACHNSHSYDTDYAAADACLSCHKDEHSLSYETSAHGEQRKTAIDQSLPLDGTVSCATCHMPRISAGKHTVKAGTLDANGEASEAETVHKLWRVQHNQNWNLRPNEKMIRPVCMSCHSLEFSIDALADEALIKNNFSGQPSEHVESVDWALERENR